MRSQKISQARDEAGATSLMTIARSHVGVRRAIKALTFMAAWDQARTAMRRESITLAEYAEWWKVSHGTSFREQATFREAFPGEQTPDRLLDVADEQWSRRRGMTGLGQVRVTL